MFEKLLLLLLLSAFSRGGETLSVEAEFPRLTSLVGFEGQGPVILGEHIMAEYRKSGVMNFRRFSCVQMIMRIICGFSRNLFDYIYNPLDYLSSSISLKVWEIVHA